MRGELWIFALVPVIVVAGIATLALMAFGFSRLLFDAFAWGSGLKRLAEQYAVDAAPEGERLTRQTVQVGAVRYRRSVDVIVSSEGLFLEVLPPVPGQERLLIPWSDVRPAGEAMLYWHTATRLEVGEPVVATLAVLPSLQLVIAPYLYLPRT